MGWNYITTIRVPKGQECKLPHNLQEYLRTKYRIEVPEDFGPQDSPKLPHKEGLLHLFYSPSEEDPSILLVEETFSREQDQYTTFVLYGDILAFCPNCNTSHENKYKFCPMCSKELYYQI